MRGRRRCVRRGLHFVAPAAMTPLTLTRCKHIMDKVIDPSLLEAYSRGEISRREISDRMQMEIGFGDLLAALHAHGLPLPRFPSHPDSVGVKLIKRLAERARRVG